MRSQSKTQQKVKVQLRQLFLLALFSFSGACNTGEHLYVTKTIENRYTISIAKTMQQENDHSATIAMLYRDKDKGECIAVTDHLKESGKTQLNTYLQTLEGNPNLLGLPVKDTRFGKPISKQINAHNAIQAEIQGVMWLDGQWQNVWGILAYIEGKTHIYQITAWLVNDEPGEDDTRLHQMINSFEEIKEEVY